MSTPLLNGICPLPAVAQGGEQPLALALVRRRERKRKTLEARPALASTVRPQYHRLADA
jgi:hypothetical protein